MPNRLIIQGRQESTTQKDPSPVVVARNAELDREAKRHHDALEALHKKSMEIQFGRAELAINEAAEKLKHSGEVQNSAKQLRAQIAAISPKDADARTRIIKASADHPLGTEDLGTRQLISDLMHSVDVVDKAREDLRLHVAEKDAEQKMKWETIIGESYPLKPDGSLDHPAAGNKMREVMKSRQLHEKQASLGGSEFDRTNPDDTKLQEKIRVNQAGVAGAKAIISRIEKQNSDYASRYQGDTNKRQDFNSWLYQNGLETEYHKAKSALDTHQAALDTLSEAQTKTDPAAAPIATEHPPLTKPVAPPAPAAPGTDSTSSRTLKTSVEPTPAKPATTQSKAPDALPPIQYGTGGAKSWQDSTPETATHVSVNYLAPDGRGKSQIIPIETFKEIQNDDVSRHFPGSTDASTGQFAPHPKEWQGEDYSHVLVPEKSGSETGLRIAAPAYKIVREAKQSPVSAADEYQGQ